MRFLPNLVFWRKSNWILDSNCTFGTRNNTNFIKLVGVLCPLPIANVTDNLKLVSNKTEYRYGDLTKFACVGDFELKSQLAATRKCIVDANSPESGTWTGELPICQGNYYLLWKHDFLCIWLYSLILKNHQKLQYYNER